MDEVKAVPAAGAKCDRCGRALRNAYKTEAGTFGPICVRKMGFTPVVEGRPASKRVASEEDEDSDQLTIFEVDTAAIERQLLEELKN